MPSKSSHIRKANLICEPARKGLPWQSSCDSDFAGNTEAQNQRRSRNGYIATCDGAPVLYGSKVSSVASAHPDIAETPHHDVKSKSEHARSSEFKLEAESIEATLMARHLCEEFLGHGVYDCTLEEAKVGLRSQRHHANFYPHAPALGNADVNSNMLGSSIKGDEPIANGSHDSHGDQDYERRKFGVGCQANSTGAITQDTPMVSTRMHTRVSAFQWSDILSYRPIPQGYSRVPRPLADGGFNLHHASIVASCSS